MVKEIVLNNTKVQYILQYKNVKNINIRIKPDGNIFVSANKRIPQRIIKEFIVSKGGFILDALEKYRDLSSVEQKQNFSEDEIKEEILMLCNKVYPYYEKRGVKYPLIKFRKMVSCWGSCNWQKGILTFNTHLMYAPRECVEYVVFHEFTHFLQHNHSSAFYDELTVAYPDWKECRRMLKEICIR